MGLRLKRVADELRSAGDAFIDWYDEMVVENGPRYLRPGEWAHLAIDSLGATFQLFGRFFDRLHYTLAHAVGVGLPLYVIFRALQSLGFL